MVTSLTHQRVERVFVRLSDELEAASLFLDIGFTLYTRDDIFHLEGAAAKRSLGLLKPAGEEAQWGIARLYALTTPGAVRAAEGMGKAGSRLGQPTDTTGWEGHYVWEKQGEIVAYVRLSPGRLGHWMHLSIHPDEASHTVDVVENALTYLPEGPVRTVYCGLRAYQAHLRRPLQDLGFRFLTSRSVMVRLNSVPATVSEAKRAPALEKRAEAHTPTTARTTTPKP
jgi:hypothetical protein